MLIDTVKNCTAAIQELSDLREKSLSIDAFEHAVGRLVGAKERIDAFVTTFTEMNGTGFCEMQFDEEQREHISETITRCGHATQQMELTSADVSALIGLVDTQKMLLNVCWQANAKEYAKPITSFLSVILSLLDNKEEARRLLSSIEAGAAAEPTPAVIKAFVANVNKANGLTSGFEMSDTVRSFLQKVKASKATLADITPEVKDWVAEHQLEQKIRISF